jgi:hypothetical protein
MIAANAAADNHKIAAQRHGNSVRRNITAACRQLVLVERRLRIRPQEVFFSWSPHAIAFGSGADCSSDFRACQIQAETKGLSERGRPGGGGRSGRFVRRRRGGRLGVLRSFVRAPFASQPATASG